MHHRELGDYGGSSVDPPRPPCPPCPPYLRVSVSPWFLPFVRSVRLVVQGPTERRPPCLRISVSPCLRVVPSVRSFRSTRGPGANGASAFRAAFRQAGRRIHHVSF